MAKLTPKQTRLAALIGGFAFLALAAGLALTALEDNIVFFRSPSELAANPATPGEAMRVGGLVQEGSVARDGLRATFAVTDLAHTIKVSYEGMLPDLFREGQGVVAEGRFNGAGLFIADTVLAKHDETYMPPEVAEALEKSGKYNQPHPGKSQERAQ
ncbi:MAG: cytochrome c maturation protein CcmE [Rhodobiaceae bacterium]|nr:cytochrome c maturation protein CcmE [Rhodobiaceae bacterium]MBT5518025.1 cytochrome c maturation protein CcmE [Rhodobiaceae bacterium]